MISLHLSFRHREPSTAGLSPPERERLAGILRATPGIGMALVFTPGATTDPYLDDGPPPLLAAQLSFPDQETLDGFPARALLATLASADRFPGLAGAGLAWEATETRAFPVPDAAFRTAPDTPRCSYLVAYDGVAEDPDGWVEHYIAHHVPIMARLPGIRRIEIDTPLPWHGPLPGRRARHLLRNKVAFDDAAALTDALKSPVRHEMRADFHSFPRFEGRVTHYPFATWTVVPGSTSGP
jgi:uncharacterized protein (TIGR02118 family)